MIRIILSLFILCGTSFTQAQTNTPPPAPQQETITPFIYEVKKDNQRAFLMGTMHYGVEFSSLPPFVNNFIKKSDTLVLEADLFKAQELKAKAEKPRESLQKELTEPQWNTLSKTIEPFLGANKNLINDLSVGDATALYTLAFLPKTQEPIDLYMYVQAKRNGQHLLFFEEAESQMEMLAKVMTLESLKTILDFPKEAFKKQNDQMANLYKSADDVGMNHVLEAAKKLHPAMVDQYKLMFDDRNLAWIERFDEIFDRPGTEFIAVGAGHLVGEKGLVKLLENKGYKVVKFKGSKSSVSRAVSSEK